MQSQYPPIPDGAISVKSNMLPQFIGMSVAGVIASFCAFFLPNPSSLYPVLYPLQFVYVWQPILWFVLMMAAYPFARRYYGIMYKRSSFSVKTREGWRQFPYKGLTKIVVTFAEGESLLVDVFLKNSPVSVPLVFVKERREYYYILRRALRRRGVFVP